MTDARIAAFEALCASLRALLAHLQDAWATPEVLASAHASVDMAQTACIEITALRGDPSATDQPRVAELVCESLRLNAIATSVAQRQAARTGQLLEGVREVRHSAAELAPTRAGTACDVRG